MAKLGKKKKKDPAISTASLPDIVFMLLFFFMVTTVLRTADLLVEQKMPKATQLQKLHRKSLVSHMYIGPPKQAERYGDNPRIQVNDVLITAEDIIQFVERERSELSEKDKDAMKISLKIDRRAKMGLVTDVKQELRKADARDILYSASQGTEF